MSSSPRTTTDWKLATLLILAGVTAATQMGKVPPALPAIRAELGIDLQAAFDKKLDLKTNRDHDRHHNNEKLK